MMSDFLRQLFSSATFMPHGHCYLWQPEILWLHVISDAIIGLAYASIPFALVYLVGKRKDLAFNWVFIMFGTFILACGATHVMSIWTVWEPVYRLDGLIKAITALASIGTAAALWPLIPKVLALPSSSELEKANKGLHLEIVERKRAEEALEDRNRSLTEAERLKTEFIANVSHELRTPLTLILSPLESLLQQTDTLPLEQQQVLGLIKNNAVRLLQMVNGLLDFSKIEASQIEIKRENLDVVALTKNLAADFEPLMQTKDLQSTFHCAEDRLILQMDRFLYERIVFNLLSNAVKFTPVGGRIEMHLSFDETECLRLDVKDTGIGIHKDDHQHLFKKFRQLEGSSTRRFEGTGLGLVLVKQFSELLEGSVGVDSEVGVGSTFSVSLYAPRGAQTTYQDHQDMKLMSRLPSAPIVLTEPGPKSEESDECNELPLILIAEDNEDLAAYLQSLLCKRYRTQIVTDGEQALAFVNRNQPDLILSDVMMPFRDGISLCRELKAAPAQAKIPFILLTAQTHREALLQGWEAGADEYLYKPFHPTELLTRVASLLTKVEMMRKADEQALQLVREQAQRDAAEAQIESLKIVEAELRRTNRIKDEFLATVSHELRTPMVAIQGWSEMLYENELEPDEYPAVFETLYRSARNQSELIERLLDISRIASGKMQIEAQPVQLAALLTEAIADVQLAAEGKNLQLRADLEAHLGPVAGDALRLKQVIWNLLSNAIKFSVKGGEIEITLRAQSGKAELRIRDQGEGIDPTFLPHVFESFLQENQGHSRRHGGLGLGLSIVHYLVELHGGSVRAESPGKGQGAVFIVQLPLSSSAI